MCNGGRLCLSTLLQWPEGKMIVQIGLLDKVHNTGNGAIALECLMKKKKSEAGWISDGISRKEAFQERHKRMGVGAWKKTMLKTRKINSQTKTRDSKAFIAIVCTSSDPSVNKKIPGIFCYNFRHIPGCKYFCQMKT